MSLAQLLDLSALVLGLYSAVFFAIGVLTITTDALETVTVSMWGKGRAIAIELAQQKSDFACAIVLLFMSFGLQFYTKAFMQDSGIICDSKLVGAAAAVGIASAILAMLIGPWWFYRSKLVAAVEKVYKENG